MYTWHPYQRLVDISFQFSNWSLRYILSSFKGTLIFLVSHWSNAGTQERTLKANTLNFEEICLLLKIWVSMWVFIFFFSFWSTFHSIWCLLCIFIQDFQHFLFPLKIFSSMFIIILLGWWVLWGWIGLISLYSSIPNQKSLLK